MFSKRRVETSTLNQKKTRGGKYAASRTAKQVRNKKRQVYERRKRQTKSAAIGLRFYIQQLCILSPIAL
jgi:hypothetical protein